MKTKIIRNLSLSAMILFAAISIFSCEKEDLKDENILFEDANDMNFIDNEKVSENDPRLDSLFNYTYISPSQDGEHESYYYFNDDQRYRDFLDSEGFTKDEINELLEDDSENKSLNKKSSWKNLISVLAYRDLARTDYIGMFTGKTTLCGQAWENEILGMRVVMDPNTGCADGTPKILQAFDKCNLKGKKKVHIRLKKCQDATKWNQYSMIGQRKFKRWKKMGIYPSSWRYLGKQY